MGGDTVTFVSFTEAGAPNALGLYEMTETTNDVDDCHHRPLTFTETVDLDTDVATEYWRTTAPPEAAVLAATSSGVMRVKGVNYQIVGGARVHTDENGEPFKVSILSQRQIG